MLPRISRTAAPLRFSNWAAPPAPSAWRSSRRTLQAFPAREPVAARPDLGPWLLVAIALLAVTAAKAVRLHRRLRRSEREFRQELGEGKRREAELRQSEECYRGLAENLGVGLFQTSLDGRFLWVNRAMANDAGFAHPQELAAAGGVLAPQFYVSRERRADAVRRATESPGPISYETLFHRHTGEELVAQVSMRLVRGGPGREPYLEGFFRDITKRTRALHLAATQRDLGIRLGAVSGLDQALLLCLETAIEAAGMDSGEIFLVDPDSGAVVLAAGVGYLPSCLCSIRERMGLVAEILNKVSEPVYTQQQTACAIGRQAGCKLVVRARAIIPIEHEGAIIGWLVTKSHARSELSALSRGALETVAAQVGSVIVRVQAQEALAASQSQLKALFDSLKDFLFVIDFRGCIVEANQAVIDSLGYTRQELQAKRIAEVFSSGLLSGLGSVAMEQESDSTCGTLLVREGAEIPVEIKLALGTWEGQRVVIALGRDLTERRHSELQAVSLREKTALLKEIHHRVKNNLQVISSLLSLQASQLECNGGRQLFRESQARVQAIAMLHERLYQAHDLTRIDFGDYLAALAEQILRADRKPSTDIQLRVEKEPIKLTQDAAMPCGLIVNELVTNACKYAFPEGGSGEVYLSVTRAPDGKLVLRVGDNGVGLPAGLDLRNAKTLGLQLVDDMVAQIRGTWKVESSSGTLFQIVFPSEDS